MSNLTQTINDSFIQFSGAVLQSRALVDSRDCIKPSTRQILYCMYTDKFIHSKPFQKTLKAIGSAFRIYIHGDSSVEGIIMRAGQPFAYRYPLVEVEGSYGTLMESGSWSAPRYTASRLSPLAEYLFKDLDKDTIDEWRDNYDDTEQYPSILPSKGFYNLVNGTFGLGVGASSSIPQYNLKELNKALENLLLNPNCDFDDIYCEPDFATGAILLNADEVKESHKKGTGFACRLRAVVEYNKQEKVFIVKELPFMLYTNTICKELEGIINSEDNPGIERFNDLTGEQVNLKIYLSKKANPDKVLKYLYKNTSLQTHYGINFTILENGRFPKVYTWREMLQSHINHEKEVYKKSFEFDLNKIEKRLHIIKGLLKVIEDINTVVHIIKASESPLKAQEQLAAVYHLDKAQTKAILDMRLSRLAHLEVEKLKKEQDQLFTKKAIIVSILSNETLFNEELIKGWREVADKFGDARRTQILNISKDGEEPTEKQELLINLSNQNNIYVTTTSTLYTQRRGGVGNKFKMSKGEYIIATASGTNLDTVLLFSNCGNCYHLSAVNLPFEEVIPIESLIDIKTNEKIEQLVFLNKSKQKEYIVFFTKKGILKKSKLSEYNVKRKGGIKALNLDKDDEIISILFINDERVGMLTARGQFVMCETKNIRAIGRVAKGVKGISLNNDDNLVFASIIPHDTKELVSISEKGYIKRTPLSEFNITNRGVKGGKIHKLKDEDDNLVSFMPLAHETEIVVVANRSQIKIKLNEINLLSKGAQGTKSIKLSESKVIGLLTF